MSFATQSETNPRNWICHHTIDTILYADSVEFCAIPKYTHLLACCLYQLKGETDEPSKRIGAILLFDVRRTGSGQDHSVSCKEIHRIDGIAGVLDLKWFPHLVGGCPAIVVARADGSCCLYGFTLDQEEGVSSSVIACGTAQEDGLCLGVDIAQDSCDHRLSILTTTSDGSVVCYTGSKEETDKEPSTGTYHLIETARWKAHGFEAWYGVFDIQQTSKIYSGGDDCLLKVVQVSEDMACPVLTRRYDAGLCAMQFRPGHPNELAIGGYGESVWLYDTSGKFKTPLSEIDIGGGVWRIKWCPSNSNYLATASMYNAFHILHLSENYEFSIVLHYDNHTPKALGYGISWHCGDISCDESAADKSAEPEAANDLPGCYMLCITDRIKIYSA